VWIQRSFCVLWGTLLFDYESEEDSKQLAIPKATIEVLGVSEWDGGSGRSGRVNNSFLVVSHTGTKYYMTTSTQQERDEWILHLRRALECNFANPSVTPYKPCKVKQSRPTHTFNRICAKTRNTIASLASATICKACGRAYSSSEFVQELSPFLQIGQEDSEKCCLDCKNAQSCVLWLKSLNYVHVMTMHEFSTEVLTDIQRFEASFLVRKRLSHRLEMASQLLNQNQITLTEFEELRKIDQEYRVEKVQEETTKFAIALDAIGQNMLMILGLLMKPPSSTELGGRTTYHKLIVKILEIADAEPALIDFYLPQLMQVHLQESLHRTTASMMRIDLLQQALLVLGKRYPALALKMSWGLIAALGDYNEKRVTQAQYSCCACLLLQLEMIVCGEISSVCDNPLSTALADIIRPCGHQKQELCNELGALFLSRRRLQEIFDEEANAYQLKRKLSAAAKIENNSSTSSGASRVHGSPSSTLTVPNGCSAHGGPSCLDLLKNIGVGPRTGFMAEPASPLSNLSRSNSSELTRSRSATREIMETLANSSLTHQQNTNAVYEIGYCEQIRFIDRLSELVESLRFIHRPSRTDALCRELSKWNQSESILGWDPTVLAGEPSYKLKRIVIEDCRVFRTKARAPSLIVCEVLRQDVRLDAKGDLIIPQVLTVPDASTPSPVGKGSTPNHIGAPLSGIHGGHSNQHSLNNTPSRLSSDSYEEEGNTLHAPYMHKRRSSSILADSAEAYIRTGEMHQVDGLVDQSILQAIEEIQRSKDAAGDEEPLDMEKIEQLKQAINEEASKDIRLKVDTDDVQSEISSVMSEPVSKSPLVDDGPPAQEVPVAPAALHHSPKPTVRRPSAPAASGGGGGSMFAGSLNSSGSGESEYSTPSRTRRATNGIAGTGLSNAPSSASKLNSSQSFSVFKAALDTVSDVGNTVKDKSAPHIRGMLKRILPMSPPPRPATSSRTFSPFAFAGEAGAATSASATFTHSRSANDLQSLGQPHPQHAHVDSSQHSDGSNNSSKSISGLSNASGSSHGQGVKKSSSAQFSPMLISNKISQLVSGHGTSANTDIFPSKNSARGRSVSSDFVLQSSSSASFATAASPSPTDEDVANNNKLVMQNAQQLLSDGKIDKAEYDLLVKSDGRYRHEFAKVDEELTMTRVESAYGENWQAKRERILGSRAHITAVGGDGGNQSERSAENEADNGNDHCWPVWDLRSFIVKSNDDLRQEVCCLQIMQLCKEIFEEFDLSSQLWLKPYRIVSTGCNTGIVQVLTDSMSLDALKKTNGFHSLPFYFKSTYGSSPERIQQAKQNFMSSLAAYSLFTYILGIKDRHNGNILIDTEGHILHIDFGFLLGIAPGGAFSLETAPFKLTEEMVEVLGGLESKLFGEFVKAFTAGFYALRANAETIISTLHILATNSPYPCFLGKDISGIIDRLRSRFRNDLSVKEVVQYCLDLIIQSYGNYGTKQYDSFQWYTNGIVP
jgi:hypothetical protein